MVEQLITSKMKNSVVVYLLTPITLTGPKRMHTSIMGRMLTFLTPIAIIFFPLSCFLLHPRHPRSRQNHDKLIANDITWAARY